MRCFTKLFVALFFASLLALFTEGCKPSVGGNAKAFDTASPEVKTAWAQSLAAAKTNDFAGAIVGLQRLKQQTGLSAQQTEAIDKSLTAVSDQMYEAANNGDANAKKAINDLRLLRGR